MSPIDRLRRLDPAAWGLPLSPEMARVTWSEAVEDLAQADLGGALPGTPPRRVGIVASANVYTAPLPWLAQLSARGVAVVLKPARGQLAAATAMAACFPGVEVRPWVGGDVAAEAAALHDADGVIAFGTAPTLAALRSRLRVPLVGFGPRFGVVVCDTPGPPVVDDVVRYDGRGCMSPAGVFAARWDLDALAGWMAEAEARWPRGVVEPAEATAIRTRVLLARAAGEVRVGERWAVLALPARHFSPLSLPRVLVVHPLDGIDVVLPYAAELGTVAADGALADRAPAAPRRCAPGRMQRPGAGRFHEGVDVLGALWGPG